MFPIPHPPLYCVTQPTNGETVGSAYAEFQRRYGLPPAEAYESTPKAPKPHKAALYLIFTGPVPVEFAIMAPDALDILTTRIVELLHTNPTGLTAREIAAHLQTEQVFSDTALKELIAQQRVVGDMKPTTTPNHFRTVYFLAAPV
jgi:hypothetical protein